MSHWIQVELQANGNQTECLQIDLERINRVQKVRRDKKIVGVLFFYTGMEMPNVLENEAAKSFETQWELFMNENDVDKFKHRDPENEPSTIQVANTSQILELNKRN